MPPQLRDYQARAVAAVLAHLPAPTCLVAPTGAGKTVMGAAVASRYDRPLWITHRRELADQAPCRAVTVQALLATGDRPDADLVIYDECHASVAPEWSSVLRHYDGLPLLGLTATPQRGDGAPLGDTYRHMVVAAQYSELLAAGHLVPCRLYAPPRQQRGLAMSVADAWQRYAVPEQRRGFVYVDTMTEAEAVASSLPRAAAITAETPARDRAEAMAAFRAGQLDALVNVYTLTEGVDVPEASVAVLARGCQHVGTYLQIAGRVLRPAPGKSHAIVVDLVGSSLAHGLPTADREYSLDGDGVARGNALAVAQCRVCGACYPPAPACPECGHVQDRKGRPVQWAELREAYASGDHAAIYRALRARGLPPEQVQSRYRALTGETCYVWDATAAERAAAFERFRAAGRAKGWKPGYAAVRYKELFGQWPRRV